MEAGTTPSGSTAGMRGGNGSMANRQTSGSPPGSLARNAPNGSAHRLARGLGWFSIGLGLAELLAPRMIARVSGGTGRHTGLIRLYGLREIASGLLIFGRPDNPAPGVWSRVVGDAIDLATLGAAAASSDTNKAGVAFAATNVLAVTALDVTCARQLSGQASDATVTTVKSIVIHRAASDIYRLWRDPENLPRFMYHLESVRKTGPQTSHWVAHAPGGTRVEWDSEITEDVPDRLIAWRSLDGADVPNSGRVEFERAPGDRGTIVRVQMEYAPPAGRLGVQLAKLFNESPEQQLYDDLRRLKQVIEVGEVVRSDGSPRGFGEVRQRPAQPLESAPEELPMAMPSRGNGATSFQTNMQGQRQ
jgi:uncharacterized membrane protein